MKKPEGLFHASKIVVDGILFQEPIDEKDVARIKAQCRANPARVWPALLAAEWDISEALAKRFIKGKV